MNPVHSISFEAHIKVQCSILEKRPDSTVYCTAGFEGLNPASAGFFFIMKFNKYEN
jgi:hypothetical protein